jgi:uncharacterized protein YqjF (DUF2071 family)
MTQTWHDLLFAHWPIDASALRPLIPAPLEVDLHDGRAWIGVVPFRMSAVRVRMLPPVPGNAAFPELNVRTYVRLGPSAEDGIARTGVWFFSLDATPRLVVAAARATFHLPYFRARMRCEARGEAIEYDSQRTHDGAPPAAWRGRYEPTGPVFRSRPGSLEHWLTERYCLWAQAPNGRLLRGDIHHEPWPLQPARLAVSEDTMAAAHGLRAPPGEPHLLFARRLLVRIWRPRREPRPTSPPAGA